MLPRELGASLRVDRRGRRRRGAALRLPRTGAVRYGTPRARASVGAAPSPARLSHRGVTGSPQLFGRTHVPVRHRAAPHLYRVPSGATSRTGRGRVRTTPSYISGRPRGLAEASLDGASGPLALQRSPAPAIGGQYTACAQGGCLATLLAEPFGPLYQPPPPVAALAADLPRSTRLLQGLRGAPTLHSCASTADEPLGTPLGADEQPWPSPRRP